MLEFRLKEGIPPSTIKKGAIIYYHLLRDIMNVNECEKRDADQILDYIICHGAYKVRTPSALRCAKVAANMHKARLIEIIDTGVNIDVERTRTPLEVAQQLADVAAWRTRTSDSARKVAERLEVIRKRLEVKAILGIDPTINLPIRIR